MQESERQIVRERGRHAVRECGFRTQYGTGGTAVGSRAAPDDARRHTAAVRDELIFFTVDAVSYGAEDPARRFPAS